MKILATLALLIGAQFHGSGTGQVGRITFTANIQPDSGLSVDVSGGLATVKSWSAYHRASKTVRLYSGEPMAFAVGDAFVSIGMPPGAAYAMLLEGP